MKGSGFDFANLTMGSVAHMLHARLLIPAQEEEPRFN